MGRLMIPCFPTVLCSALLATSMCLDIVTAAQAPRVVSMQFQKAPRSKRGMQIKRATVSVPLQNRIDTQAYIVNTTVGTPGQPIQFGIDTGSSDIWMFAPGVCNVDSYDSLHPCVGGEFNSSASSSFQLLGKNTFSIEYVDGRGVTGDYFNDNIQIGDSLIRGQRLAQATESKDGHFLGVMGIGYRVNEASAQPYPVLLDNMVSQGLVASHTYSLWLDDLSSNTGTILFGGYDRSKYIGELVSLPIQPDSYSDTLTQLSVTWSSLGVTDPTGSISLTSPDFPISATLDTGTSLTYIPPNLYNELVQYFAIDPAYSYSDVAITSCPTLRSQNGTLDFGFGGPSGPVIRVPFSELAIPAYDFAGDAQTLADGSPACYLGVAPALDGVFILGDTMLRSAYVVYDLAHNQISLAQTAFAPTAPSDVFEIPADLANLPDVSSTATAAAQVTGPPGYGGYGGYDPYGGYGGYGSGYPGSSSSSFFASGLSLPPLFGSSSGAFSVVPTASAAGFSIPYPPGAVSGSGSGSIGPTLTGFTSGAGGTSTSGPVVSGMAALTGVTTVYTQAVAMTAVSANTGTGASATGLASTAHAVGLGNVWMIVIGIWAAAIMAGCGGTWMRGVL